MMATEREPQVQTDRWAAWQGGMGPRPVIVKTDEIKNGHYQRQPTENRLYLGISYLNLNC